MTKPPPPPMRIVEAHLGHWGRQIGVRYQNGHEVHCIEMPTWRWAWLRFCNWVHVFC